MLHLKSAFAAGATILRSEMKLILAGFIGEIRDPLAVGRPRRIAFRCAYGVGEIANVSVFYRNSQYFAVRFEDSARATW